MIKHRKKRADKERLKSTSSNRSNEERTSTVSSLYDDDGDDGSGLSEGLMEDLQNGHARLHRSVSTSSSTHNNARKLTRSRKRSGNNQGGHRNSWLPVVFILTGAVLALLLVHVRDLYRLRKDLEGAAGLTSGGLLPEQHHLEVVDESEPIHVLKQQQVERKSSGDFLVRAKDGASSSGANAEALKSLGAALTLKAKKMTDKARKVFLHAIALSPNNPRILNCYGEFVEEVDLEVLEADHLYTKAMIYSDSDSEEHVRAVANRQRTSALVDEIDGTMLAAVDEKKKAFVRINYRNPAFRRAKKEAYFQHVYHTVAIEGNTMSLPQTRSILETKLAVGGKSIMEHNEVLGLDAALKYINQTLVDRVTGDIRMQDILEIHRRVIGYTDPSEAGMFRRTQVFVGDHIPPAAGHIDQLMRRFLLWLNSNEAMVMHPVRLAALAHYKLVYIHPFVDGNGRTSRLLMNLILMQHGFPPVIIRKQDRLQYYQYLVTANEGDVRPFVRFIAKCTDRTLQAYLLSCKENSLVPFTTDDVEATILPGKFQKKRNDEDLLAKYDKVVMGGSVVTPSGAESNINSDLYL